jgi:hypothetical protein
MGRGGDATQTGPPLLPRRNSFNVTMGNFADVMDDMKVLKSIWFSSAHRGSAGKSSTTDEHQQRLEAFYAGQAALCESLSAEGLTLAVNGWRVPCPSVRARVCASVCALSLSLAEETEPPERREGRGRH